MKLLNVFALYRKIFCTCSCGEVFRLSDTQIVDLRREVPKDWLGDLQFTMQRLQRSVAAAETRFESQRERVMDRERRKAQALCHRAVETVLPRFGALKLNTNDIKCLFSPVRFVAFDGAFERAVRRVCFIDTPPQSLTHEKVQNGIKRVIKKGDVTWACARVDNDGRVTRE